MTATAEAEERGAPPDAPLARGKRWALLAIGWVCVALAALGAVLPLVPTVPFLLVAVWAFARSSRRFHDWIYGHRLFGPPLQAWYRYRVISPRAKALATAAMALSLVYVIVIAKAPWWAILAMATVLSAIAGYILSRRSRPPRSARGSAGAHE